MEHKWDVSYKKEISIYRWIGALKNFVLEESENSLEKQNL